MKPNRSTSNVAVDPVDGRVSAEDEDDYVGGYSVVIGGRSTTVDGSSVGVGTVSVDSGVFAEPGLSIDMLADEDDDNDNGDVELELVDEEDGGCCCCRNSSCCRDEAIYCRTCGRNGCEFVGEVGELIGKLELRRRARQLFSVQTIKDRLPITTWLPKYRLASQKA